MKKLYSEFEKKELKFVKKEMNDLLTLYLDTEAADDTQDRRNKISATNNVNSILNNLLT